MHKGLKTALLGAAIAALVPGCGQRQETAAPAEIAGQSAEAEAFAFEDKAEQDGGTREFAYKWPAAAAAVPALAARLTADRDEALAAQKSDWDRALADFAGEDCASCKSLSYAKEWKVVADLPRFLSLSADIYAFTGGAHGNSTFDALVWDREAGTALAPLDMFGSPAALEAAVREAWCAGLKQEKAKKLGPDAAVGESPSDACPALSELTLLVGSSDGKAFDRLGLLAAPYVAGSYAEGSYEVTLPVTPAVLEAVKPEYRAAFAPGA